MTVDRVIQSDTDVERAVAVVAVGASLPIDVVLHFLGTLLPRALVEFFVTQF